MTKKIKNIKGKIGYCSNKDLHIKNKYGTSSNGHYVYIRKVNKNGTCDVNTITSLEDKNGYSLQRVKKVKYGYIYPIPKYDANFVRWSGINKNSIHNVQISSIKDIGNKKIKKRHSFFIGKFSK